MLLVSGWLLKLKVVRTGWRMAVAAGIIAVLLGIAGLLAWLHQPPAYDVVHTARWVVIPANEGRSAAYCTLDIANTGRKPQDDVAIRFLKSTMDHALLRPIAKDAGLIERKLAIRTSGMLTTLHLGRMEPGARVTVNLILNYSALETPPTWETAFRGIEPARGKARIGNPAAAATSPSP